MRKAEDAVRETWSNYILASLAQDPRVAQNPLHLPETLYLHQRLLAAALAHCQARQKLEALQLLEKA